MGFFESVMNYRRREGGDRGKGVGGFLFIFVFFSYSLDFFLGFLIVCGGRGSFF